MAKVGSPKGFWDILKSISITEIAQQANRPISLAVVGPEEARSTAIQALFTESLPGAPEAPEAPRALPEAPFLEGYDSTAEADGFPQNTGVYDLVLDVGGRQNPPENLSIYTVAELGGWEATLTRILEDRPELALPLSRNFPAFRRRVAQRIVTETAVANAQFALLTGISAALPISAIFLPVNSLSDIVMLTKNQAMMVLRLAAAYGLPVDAKSRFKEVVPILGNAFGWRAIARELIGAVPFVGLFVRAMIAYAGTITVGKAAMLYYETGENPTSAQARLLYKEAYQASRETVRALASALKPRRGKEPLPAVATEAGDPRPIENDVIETELLPIEENQP